MAYEFTNAKVGSVILQHFNGSYGTTLKFDGVNAQISDANVIIGAMNQLLGIVNFQNKYEPTNLVRKVNQNVVSQQ